MSGELEHARADLPCEVGLHAFVNGICRDCGLLATGQYRKETSAEFDARIGRAIGGRNVDRPALRSKKFLVQFESAADTRWVQTDAQLLAVLENLATSIGMSATQGPVPLVRVIIEAQPEGGR